MENSHQPKIKKTSSFQFSAFCLVLGAISFMILDFSCTSKESSKFTQYYNQGEALYLKHCSNCHQKNGTGLGRIYPPLEKSDYMNNNFTDVICLIRYGKKEPLMVNGKDFNQAMPGILTLTDLEIAEISTYIYNSWGNQKGIIEVREVSVILQTCPPAQ
jgi:cytochrome c551